jgi:hypothetical protein
MATVSAPPEGGSDDGTMANMMQSLMGSASATLIGCYAKGTFRMQIVLDGTIALDDTPGDPNKAFLTNFNLQFGFAPVAYVGFGVAPILRLRVRVLQRFHRLLYRSLISSKGR